MNKTENKTEGLTLYTLQSNCSGDTTKNSLSFFAAYSSRAPASSASGSAGSPQPFPARRK